MGAKCLGRGSETNRNGAAVLFNSNFEYKVHSVVRDTDGCFIIMDIEMMNERSTLANVYIWPQCWRQPRLF